MIRPAVRSDLPWLIDALGRLDTAGTDADNRYAPRPDHAALLRAHLDEMWFGRFHKFPQCLVAEADGAHVGLVAGSGLLTVTISDLWVEPAWRRRGVGRGLVTAFLDAARAAGCVRLRVGTLARDERAIAFWRALGFVDLWLTLEYEPSD